MSKKLPTFSIIIPSYNRPKQLVDLQLLQELLKIP
jgi:glycosyltransferase involved in cell wall biosynthesis